VQELFNVVEGLMVRIRFAALATCLIAMGAMFQPGKANAAPGFVVGHAEMHAGPDYEYPTVAVIGDGGRVEIFGCLDDWSWCDVGYRYDRGWVAGEELVADYHYARQPLYDVAPFIGIGVIAFSFDTYWGAHYHSRPFFHDRARWRTYTHTHYRTNWGGRRGGDHHGHGRAPGHADRTPDRHGTNGRQREVHANQNHQPNHQQLENSQRQMKAQQQQQREHQAREQQARAQSARTQQAHEQQAREQQARAQAHQQQSQQRATRQAESNRGGNRGPSPGGPSPGQGHHNPNVAHGPTHGPTHGTPPHGKPQDR
jgi:uncharacterized protein YraI